MTTAKGAVLLAYLHATDVAHSWHASMMGLLLHDMAHQQRTIRGGILGMRCSSGMLADRRDDVARKFVTESNAEWLFWLDTDMGFAADTLDRLVNAADKRYRPVVGGLCFVQNEHGNDGVGGYRTAPVPTLYRFLDEQGATGFYPVAAYRRGRTERVDATGSACVLIHRDAMTRVLDKFDTAYERMRVPGMSNPIGEDMSLCLRLRELGIPVHVDTSIRTTHMKTQWVGEPDYEPYRPEV